MRGPKGLEETGALTVIQTTIGKGTLEFCGIKNVTYKNCFAVPTVSDEERKRHLEEIASLIQQL
ncbi:hypothetical protein [Desulfofundulus kuznetsovii]|uniref:hypothetical protein n=1 Tax=Desulfofundulus kuznetsovii TaxID=58135 RepID=UPI0002E60F70